jgi:hypothetical protein
MTASGCDFNRSMQHLNSNTREGGVADGLPKEKIFHRSRVHFDVGSLAGWRFIA